CPILTTHALGRVWISVLPGCRILDTAVISVRIFVVIKRYHMAGLVEICNLPPHPRNRSGHPARARLAPPLERAKTAKWVPCRRQEKAYLLPFLSKSPASVGSCTSSPAPCRMLVELFPLCNPRLPSCQFKLRVLEAGYRSPRALHCSLYIYGYQARPQANNPDACAVRTIPTPHISGWRLPSYQQPGNNPWTNKGRIFLYPTRKLSAYRID
ncbi:hypothetical protein QBC37DRAFT_445574, partial [Rhypophila decipiens]